MGSPPALTLTSLVAFIVAGATMEPKGNVLSTLELCSVESPCQSLCTWVQREGYSRQTISAVCQDGLSSSEILEVASFSGLEQAEFCQALGIPIQDLNHLANSSWHHCCPSEDSPSNFNSFPDVKDSSDSCNIPSDPTERKVEQNWNLEDFITDNVPITNGLVEAELILDRTEQIEMEKTHYPTLVVGFRVLDLGVSLALVCDRMQIDINMFQISWDDPSMLFENRRFQEPNACKFCMDLDQNQIQCQIQLPQAPCGEKVLYLGVIFKNAPYMANHNLWAMSEVVIECSTGLKSMLVQQLVETYGGVQLSFSNLKETQHLRAGQTLALDFAFSREVKSELENDCIVRLLVNNTVYQHELPDNDPMMKHLTVIVTLPEGRHSLRLQIVHVFLNTVVVETNSSVDIVLDHWNVAAAHHVLSSTDIRESSAAREGQGAGGLEENLKGAEGEQKNMECQTSLLCRTLHEITDVLSAHSIAFALTSYSALAFFAFEWLIPLSPSRVC